MRRHGCESRVSGVNEWDESQPYRVFVDESEVSGYSITAVYVRPQDVHKIRTVLRKHLRSGQRSIHFTKERPEVRKAVIADIAKMPIKAELYKVAEKHREARSICLQALAETLRDGKCQQLVLDQNDSVCQSDRRVLRSALGPGWSGTYDHFHDHEEALLWLPDAISWCWNKGGNWRARLSEMDLKIVPLAR